MAELTQAAAEVYAPRTVQAWRTLWGWLAFVFHVVAQIPSLASILSFIGLRNSLLCNASSASSPAFKPLPVVELSPEEGGLGDVSDASDDKFTVVLDLDETLVCAYETSSLPMVIRNQAIEAGLKCFELECISVEKLELMKSSNHWFKEGEGKQKVNHVTVFERPGLQEFLRQINEFADLVLFTAGLEGYARPLVDRIDAENRFILRLYRPATSST
ncbi:hypothetical protein QJS10_CPB21g01265 [Acorus calamus]|uniref:Mitochondrial import inner membrane translocase subunit TIM50 n=1 Tax=Acorus calamus TaxID=4465 RepID=A0AAV9C515_ACOCL|nr:hypothetical protein QJS10_CPB21g01265 [Acorus calamus]